MLTYVVRSPRDDAPGSRAPKKVAPILVVDDDPRVRRVVCDALEEEGWAVVVAEDGQQATEEARRHAPALVILDVTLPVMDGYALATALRASHGAALPILVMSADGQVAAKAQRIGAYAYLRKPFDLDTLVRLVESRLQRP